MRDVVISGVGMTVFGKHPLRPVSSLVAEAVYEALTDAGIGDGAQEVESVYYGNVLGGLLQGQESVRGQHAVRGTALAGVPLINVENACASGATALNQAWLAVGSGQVDVAVAIGAEKLIVEERGKALASLTSVLDQERLGEVHAELGSRDARSVFMDIYARFAAWYQESSDATPEDFALVSVKNAAHGAANPKAQYGRELTVAEVLAARPVSGPLTVPMCAPLSDGAAAVVLTTPELARRAKAAPVRVLASMAGSGRPGVYGELVPSVAARAYAAAGVGPADIDIVECHDAAAPAELIVLEQLGLCGAGEAPSLLRAGATRIGGRLPVNPSGGLVSKGHPLGATGLAQVIELTDQLRGRAADRQVDGARYAVAENAGGYIGPDAAVAAVTVLAGSG